MAPLKSVKGIQLLDSFLFRFSIFLLLLRLSSRSDDLSKLGKPMSLKRDQWNFSN